MFTILEGTRGTVPNELNRLLLCPTGQSKLKVCFLFMKKPYLYGIYNVPRMGDLIRTLYERK